MFSLELTCLDEYRDLLIADLWEAGSEGITEKSDTCVRAFFPDDALREVMLDRFAAFSPELEEEEDRDWVAEVRSSWKPFAVGARFYLVPQWLDDPAPAGRLRIAINPGLAFGTGTHEATQLCMEALERHVQPGATVADIGTGSGILSTAAALLGAGFVAGCDTDADAVEVAHLAATQARFFTGSVDAVRTRSIDVVVANISPEAIIALAPEILRALKPGGIALTSGFEIHEAPTVRAALETAGARVVEQLQKNTWCFLGFSPVGAL